MKTTFPRLFFAALIGAMLAAIFIVGYSTLARRGAFAGTWIDRMIGEGDR